MAQAVARAIRERRPLVAEAGTGTGKTFAYLVPALLYGGKVIVSTGTKTLQDQLFERDLPLIRDALAAPVTVALLKGRANYVCHHHLERTAHEGRLPSRADARYLPSLVDGMQALPLVAAPDFTFEIGGQSQETLRQLRGNAVPMLVFYTLPQSLPRLRALARDASSLAKAGARIIAVPLHPSSGAAASVDAAPAAAIIATTGASVAAAYMMFARERDGAADDVPHHVEFLIDRQGDLRFRWSGDALAQTEGTSETRNRIDLLNREPPRQESAPGHAHR